MSIILQQHYSHESQLMETSSTLLCKLKVSNSKSMIDNSDSSSRSFLHVLSDISSSYLKVEENVYIHPLSQRSNSSKLKLLNEKSLQLCTENLGSETGSTDIIKDSNAFIQCLDSMENPTGFIRQQQVVEKDSRKKINNNSNRKSQFPPPLTTLSGEKTIRVTTHRESGRLVIKAVAATTLNQSCFQAQRSHGNLRLCYLNYEAVDSDLKVKGPNENDYNNNGDELENDDESHNQEEDEDNKVNCNQMNKEKGEIENEIEVEFEKEKFQKVGRCKEGEHGNWESLPVAISLTFCF